MDANADTSTNAVPLPSTPVRTWRYYTVGLVTFLFLTAYNISFYTFGQYVYIKLQKEFYPNATNVSSTIAICIEDTNSSVFAIQQDVQQRAARWGIYLYLSGGITAVISNFVLGTLTDRFGRKFLFILACIGTIIRTVGAIVGIHFDLPLWFYFFGYFIEGCTGQVFNIFQVSYLYVVDITIAGKQRSVGIVLMEVAIGFGSIIPNLAAGYILQYSGSFQLPFIISLGMLVVSFILMLVLPETFPKKVRAKRDFNSKFEILKDSIDLYLSKKNAGRRWMYITILTVFALTNYNLFGRIAIEGLYLLNYPLCWDPERIGLYGAARSGAQQIIGMSLVKLFHTCMDDEMIGIIGSVSYAASFVLEAFSTDEAMMYGGMYQDFLKSCTNCF